MEAHSATADRVVEAATPVVQTRGYNGFSYADIADMVGIRTSSVHHHFPGKGDLGLEVARMYRNAFGWALAEIESDTDDRITRLERYAELYARQLSKHGRMCLCGMLAAEYATLRLPFRVRWAGSSTTSGRGSPACSAGDVGRRPTPGVEPMCSSRGWRAPCWSHAPTGTSRISGGSPAPSSTLWREEGREVIDGPDHTGGVTLRGR